MSTPQVSVLIPCRNAEPYLAETIRSVMEQRDVPLEIIVVDDGSTDRSRDIAMKFDRVTLVSNPGRGVSAARNYASSIARGEYFQYLDADDLLTPGCLNARLTALRAAPGDVAISDWERLVERDGKWVSGKVECGQLPGMLSSDLAIFRGFWAPLAAVLYHRSIWAQVGGWRENLPIVQDARFLFDAARAGARFVHVPSVGARYRQHRHGSVSTQGAALFWRDVLQNTSEIEADWRGSGRLDQARDTALAEAYATCARVGFVADRELFRLANVRLAGFPGHQLPRFLRAANGLSKIVGYPAARMLLRIGQRAAAALPNW